MLSVLTMFSYCELGTSISGVGPEYTLTKVAFGGFVSFLTGQLRWVACIFTISLVAIGFAQMVQYFIPVNMQLVAALVTVLFTLTTLWGIKEIDMMIVAVFTAIFLTFDFASLPYGLRIESVQSFIPNGLPGVLGGLMYTFSVFFGVRSIVVEGPEMENRAENVPRAILLSSVILIAIYCSVASFALGFMPLQTESSVPF